jgi:repressor of nif and glnA expression
MAADKSEQRQQLQTIVKIVRLNLYNRGLPCGDRAIRRHLDALHVRPLPSLSTINRILTSHGLTNRRTGHYNEG